VDAHVGCLPNAPVENVFWPTGGAPAGRYLVVMENYAAHYGGATPYSVTITLEGVVVDEISATLPGEGDSDHVTEFEYP
jgi:hypothetical protein